MLVKLLLCLTLAMPSWAETPSDPVFLDRTVAHIKNTAQRYLPSAWYPEHRVNPDLQNKGRRITRNLVVAGGLFPLFLSGCCLMAGASLFILAPFKKSTPDDTSTADMFVWSAVGVGMTALFGWVSWLMMCKTKTGPNPFLESRASA